MALKLLLLPELLWVTWWEESMQLASSGNSKIGTMMRKISDLTQEKEQPDLLINISKESIAIYDFYKAKEIIKEGEIATLNSLSNFA
jgi:predicted acylesterase/phospholipase RssA